MESKTFYNESLTEHNVHPYHKHTLEGANMALEGVNPSCGDDIVLLLKVEDDKIVDGAFQGDGCAVSQASADMMLDLIIGKSKDEALRLADIFLRMIRGKASEEEMDELEESSILADVAHMPARVKCACLGWHTAKEMLEKGEEADYNDILEDIKKRDYQDSHREIAPLKQADDAIYVDNAGQSLEYGADYLLNIIKEHLR